jgi:sugar phosphate isomerase/epimerase
MPALIELANLDEQVTACQKLGLNFIELNLDCPQYLPNRISPDLLRAVTAQTGVRFTAHLPENLDLGAFHTPVREGYQYLCRNVIKWASDAGIALLNLHVHPGVYFTLPTHKVWLYEQYADEYRKNLHTSFRPLCRLARERNIVLAIENTGIYRLPHMASALQELLAIGEGSLRLTWDVGHDAAAGYTDRPFLLEHQNLLAHMHLHDASGTRNHLPLWDGDAPIDEMLSLARTLGISVLVETKTLAGLQLSLERLKNHPIMQEVR